METQVKNNKSMSDAHKSNHKPDYTSQDYVQNKFVDHINHTKHTKADEDSTQDVHYLNNHHIINRYIGNDHVHYNPDIYSESNVQNHVNKYVKSQKNNSDKQSNDNVLLKNKWFKIALITTLAVVGVMLYRDNIFPKTALRLEKDVYNMLYVDKNGDRYFKHKDGSILMSSSADRVVEKADKYIIIRPKDREFSFKKWFQTNDAYKKADPLTENNFQKAYEHSIFGGWR